MPAVTPLVASHTRLVALSFGALGVVYGDIGTSPLYALQVAFSSSNNVKVTVANVLGIVSLFFWSLVVVVTFKYVAFVMRAANDGEGGIIALMALALRHATGSRERQLVVLFGLIGVALFYGDGVITPAISVLSAVEGTAVATSSLTRFEVPITLVILTLLFLYERRGTDTVGRLFGPIMVVWFVAIAALGMRGIAQNPSVFRALNPYWAVDFFAREPFTAFVALGAVVLCLTGAEALYADMGHFGRKPIAIAWLGLVLPALICCYFGQAAEILKNPKVIDNPFFRLAPHWLTLPLVVLATIATVIASQAVITGAYSMTQQAIKLAYAPRMRVRHTSHAVKGQIYVPSVNWVLYAVIVVLVVGFGSSTKLASAYGIAVTGTMAATSVLAYVVARRIWGWSALRAALIVTPLLVIDIVYFAANALKVVSGGWFPLVFGSLVFVVMRAWNQGRVRMRTALAQEGVSIGVFLEALHGEPPAIVMPGAAVFMSANPNAVPRALLMNIKHNAYLHELTVIVQVDTFDVPHVPVTGRSEATQIAPGLWSVTVRYGFGDEPDVPAALRRCAPQGLVIDPAAASYFLGRESIQLAPASRRVAWQKQLFVTLHRNASSPASFYRLPPERVLEVGSRIVI